ncbi:conserved hypothetical protein [Ricinus communis]|uniref:Uncharacterized protein n=1 Tax=Ricinus communis TaxID=3988 RepID=B9T9V9_RICCO|nr:conserved hypothetical protein [Ricinus communis]
MPVLTYRGGAVQQRMKGTCFGLPVLICTVKSLEKRYGQLEADISVMPRRGIGGNSRPKNWGASDCYRGARS